MRLMTVFESLASAFIYFKLTRDIKELDLILKNLFSKR